MKRHPGPQALFALFLVACSHRNVESEGTVASGSEGLSALAGYCRSYMVADVITDPTTFPVIDPEHLLTSAEGCGPRTLDLAVAASVSPQLVLTGTYTPQSSEISAAIGYSISSSLTLSANSTVPVPIDGYARVDAYPTFRKTTFQIVGVACPGEVPVGAGTALKPVGVLFTTCGILGALPCGGIGCVGGLPAPLTEADGGTASPDGG